MKFFNLEKPNYIFDYDLFRYNPNAFYNMAHEYFDTSNMHPTPTHCFIKLLQDKDLLQMTITKNNDGLEDKIGLNSNNNKRVMQMYGSFKGTICSECDHEGGVDPE